MNTPQYSSIEGYVQKDSYFVLLLGMFFFHLISILFLRIYLVFGVRICLCFAGSCVVCNFLSF